MVAGHLQDNGSRIGINKAPETEYRFAALRQQTSGSFAATIYAAIKGENNLTNSSTINSVGYLGVNNPGGIYPFIFPDLSVADIGILGVKENSTTEGAGVFAWNRGTAVTANYGLYAAATGSAGNKYGVYAKALGTGAVNRAIYAEASGATFNYALIVPENGGNAGFGWTAPSATLGAKSNGTDDIFKIINTGFSTKFLVDAAGSVVVNASAPTTGMELSVNGDLYASSQLSVGTTSQAAEVNIYGTDETVIIDGTNPYLQINNAGAKTGYIRASGLNFQVATNAENDNGKLEFRTNGSSRMWIDASGNVSVGGSAKVATGYLFSVVGKVMAEEVVSPALFRRRR